MFCVFGGFSLHLQGNHKYVFNPLRTMEKLLHYVWRHRLFPLHPLQTTDGQPLEVIDPGLPNADAGPDFFNAKVKVGGTLWVGNVEVHDCASDWARHGHDRNPAYDNVALHVVAEADAVVCRTDGRPIPQLVLPVPDEVRLRYADLCRTDALPPCRSVFAALPPLKIHGWLSALQTERLEQKAASIRRRLAACGGDWADAFFMTLARNFGFGLNADAFEAWASCLPLRAVDKHRDDLFQVEALFLGTAGLLEADLGADGYPADLRREYRYLRHKFNLPEPMPAARWRFLRLRPGNFPPIRLAQLAWLYCKEDGLFSRVLEAETLDEARRLFHARTSPYWTEHFHFHKASPRRQKTLGARAVDLLVLNTVVPVLYAYGQYRSDEKLCNRAIAFLESLKAEDNSVVRRWAAAGLPVRSAADSQALLQLQTAYCDKKDCLRCRFGYEYLKKQAQAGH